MNKLDFTCYKMKTKLFLTVFLIAFFVMPSHAFASTVFETTGWIIDTEGLNYEFPADQPPYTYQATLSDLSESPFFGFDFLSLSITSSTQSLGTITGPGSFTFDVVPGETLFANVFGTGSGTQSAGLFGVEIATVVPIPGAVWLFGSGLLGLIGMSRRKKAA